MRGDGVATGLPNGGQPAQKDGAVAHHAIARTTRLLPAVLGAAAAARIAPGNLVVLRVGTGASARTNAGTQVFLDEHTTADAFVQTVPMPSFRNGAQQPFTCSGTATSEGGLSQSVDGRYLVAMGHGAAPGTASIAGTASASVPRVCARIALDETIDTTTALADAYSGNNARGACSWFGGEFWTAGNATSGNGPSARHVPLAGNATFELAAYNLPAGVVTLFAIQLGAALPVALPVPGAPTCVQAYVLPDVLTTVVPDPFGAAVQPLPLRADVALGGTRVAAQAFALDFGPTGFALPLGQTDAMQIVFGKRLRIAP